MTIDEQDILRKLGARIRVYREAQGLTLVDMEVATGMPNGHLSQIENGKRAVQFFTIFRIAKALNIPLSTLADL